jgi:hypothetical protein
VTVTSRHHPQRDPDHGISQSISFLDVDVLEVVVAAHNSTGEMAQEIRHNRLRMLPGGYNAMWINDHPQRDPDHGISQSISFLDVDVLEVRMRQSAVCPNFPKYSSVVAAHNSTGEMAQEIRHNRLRMLPGGTGCGVSLGPFPQWSCGQLLRMNTSGNFGTS